MLAKDIKWTDYNGNERTETFYFNLNKAELTELQVSVNGGMQAYINKMIQSQNIKEIAAIVKEIILMSYGEKDLDGRSFRKSKSITENFVSTEAYSQLFMELVSDAQKAAEFINGIIPKELQEEIK